MYKSGTKPPSNNSTLKKRKKKRIKMVVLILILIIIILLAVLASTKLGLTAYVAWMEENHCKQPSDKDMQRLIGWCARKYVQDLFRKS